MEWLRPATLRRLLLRLLLAVLLIPAGAAMARDSGAAGGGLLQVCLAPVQPGDRAERLLTNPARFDCRRDQADFGPGDYWVRLAVPPAARPPLADQPVFSVLLGWQQHAELWSRDTSGAVSHHSLGNHDLARFSRIGAQTTVPLDSHDAPVETLLLRIDGAINATGLVQLPRIETTAAADRQHLIEAAIYAGFAGVVIALLAHNLLLWLAMRERFQLYYCLTLLAMLGYAWAHSGTVDLMQPEWGVELRIRLAYLALGLIAAGAMQFFTACVERDAFSPQVRRGLHFSSLFVAAASVLVAIAPSQLIHAADRLYVLSFVPIPILAVIAAVHGIRRGSQIVRLLALAWAFPVLMAVVRILHSANLIEYSLLVEHSAIAALGVEALLSALAMSFRIKLIARDRDSARAEEQVARRLAEVDPLTGLANRRALLDCALGWTSAERLRLVLIDIDHFKAINDRFGHDAGDDVLRGVAHAIAQQAQLRGTVARLGGEEFAILGTVDELDAGLAERLLTAVRAATMPHGVQVTVSIGLADGAIGSEADWRDLYRRADTALYRAKHGGRDRVCGPDHRPERSAAAAA